MIYLSPFLVAFSMALLFSALLIALDSFTRIFKRGRETGRVDTARPRVGGLAMLAAFVIALTLDYNLVLDYRWAVFLLALLILFSIGLVDDLKILSWRSQLFSQIAIVLFLFILGIKIEFVGNPFGEGVIDFSEPVLGALPLWSFLATAVWVIAVINALNWLDGVDGLGGAIALIAFGAIGAVSLLPHVNQPPVAIAAAALAGATGGFLFYNRFPGKILSGTGGVYFWGLSIAVLSMFAGAKIATALSVLIIPLVDAFWVIGERLLSGGSVFKADNRHLHHKLLARGYSPAAIVALYLAASLPLAWSAIYLDTFGKLTVAAAAAAATVALLLFLRKGASSSSKKTIAKK